MLAMYVHLAGCTMVHVCLRGVALFVCKSFTFLPAIDKTWILCESMEIQTYYAHARTHTLIYSHVHTRVQTCTHTCIHTYAHTHTHTQLMAIPTAHWVTRAVLVEVVEHTLLHSNSSCLLLSTNRLSSTKLSSRTQTRSHISTHSIGQQTWAVLNPSRHSRMVVARFLTWMDIHHHNNSNNNGSSSSSSNGRGSRGRGLEQGGSHSYQATHIDTHHHPTTINISTSRIGQVQSLTMELGERDR